MENQPAPKEHHTDKIGTKFVEKASDAQSKLLEKSGHKEDGDKEPAGGFDDTELQPRPPGYTLRFTIHCGTHLPASDFPSGSSDPYVHATLKTGLPKRHKQDPDLFLRTPTIHHDVNPKWETQWVVAHVPASGFFLKCRLYDEDPTDHDDRLGNVHVRADHIDDDWKGYDHQVFKLKKRMGSKRAYAIRGVRALFSRDVKFDSGSITISVENLGRSPGEDGSRVFTVTPLPWRRHYSPLIGRLTNTQDDEVDKDGKSIKKYNFQAIEMQLRGPVPAPLYHRYVEFKSFVAGMFTDHTLRGKVLNHALHHQHARVYNYDSTTVYGAFEKPCPEMTKQFLEFVHFDQGGRIFTYVLSLDGLWRFTETGKEFGIDMLSKHTMHSDVSNYIAFSGEFFIRKIKRQQGGGDGTRPRSSDSDAQLLPPGDMQDVETKENGEHDHSKLSQDPADYELIIDNDSGTYRPNAKLLPLLKAYMSENLQGMRVATLDCQADEEKMKKLKDEQRERKKNTGNQITYMQNSSNSSLSSSDQEELEARAHDEKPRHGYQRKMDTARHHNHSSETDNNDDSVQVRADTEGGKYSNRRTIWRRKTDEMRRIQNTDPSELERDSSGSSSSSDDDYHPASNGQNESQQDARVRKEVKENEVHLNGGFKDEDLPLLLKHNKQQEGMSRGTEENANADNTAKTLDARQSVAGDSKQDSGVMYHHGVTATT